MIDFGKIAKILSRSFVHSAARARRPLQKASNFTILMEDDARGRRQGVPKCLMIASISDTDSRKVLALRCAVPQPFDFGT